MQLLAAACVIQLSCAFVAEVQAQATLMLGTMGEGKTSKQVITVVNYSTQSKLLSTFGARETFIALYSERTIE